VPKLSRSTVAASVATRTDHRSARATTGDAARPNQKTASPRSTAGEDPFIHRSVASRPTNPVLRSRVRKPRLSGSWWRLRRLSVTDVGFGAERGGDGVANLVYNEYADTGDQR
jgi:hypothetical protein